MELQEAEEMTADDLNRSQIVGLAKMHIARFYRMIESGSLNVRVDECEHYLRIWKEVEKKGDIRELTEEERNEVEGAISSGDYDAFLEASRG